MKEENLVCISCWSELAKTNLHREEENEFKKRFYGKVEIDLAMSFYKFTKSGKIQKLLHALKYNNKPELGVLIGRKYGMEVKELVQKSIDIIVPIPLHKKRLKQRGYNQSDAFAQGLSEALSIPWTNTAVARVVESESQTQKNRIERWKNVEHIFKVQHSEELQDKRILLVDDVVTTGSTLEACAKVLLAHAKSVSIATIAIA